MQLAVVLTAVLLFVARGARADVSVWTVSDTQRVLREDPAGHGTEVSISAACNEWESFQVLLRSGQPVGGVNLGPGDLRGPGGAVLPAATAVLYRQHQLQLTDPTYRNDGFRPGSYPDALIPFRHPVTGQPLDGGRLRAVPFDLPANETHGFWVDVFVPTDARPGSYRGTYRLTSAAGAPAEIAVALTVWDFALPATPAMQTALGSPADRMRGYYQKRAKDGKEPEPTDWAAVETQCAKMLSDHRINATPPRGSLVPEAQPDGSFRIPDQQVTAFREFVDRYHLNAHQLPHPNTVVKDPDPKPSATSSTPGCVRGTKRRRRWSARMSACSSTSAMSPTTRKPTGTSRSGAAPCARRSRS
jgi:hypothetical protein